MTRNVGYNRACTTKRPRWQRSYGYLYLEEMPRPRCFYICFRIRAPEYAPEEDIAENICDNQQYRVAFNRRRARSPIISNVSTECITYLDGRINAGILADIHLRYQCYTITLLVYHFSPDYLKKGKSIRGYPSYTKTPLVTKGHPVPIRRLVANLVL